MVLVPPGLLLLENNFQIFSENVCHTRSRPLALTHSRREDNLVLGFWRQTVPLIKKNVQFRLRVRLVRGYLLEWLLMNDHLPGLRGTEQSK